MHAGNEKLVPHTSVENTAVNSGIISETSVWEKINVSTTNVLQR